MRFSLSPHELFEAIRAAEMSAGLIVLRLPRDALLSGSAPEPAGGQVILDFLDAERKVIFAGRVVQLSCRQFNVIRHIYTSRRADFEGIQDACWGGSVASDGAIRAAFSKINTAAMRAEARFEIRHSAGVAWVDCLD